MDGARGRLLAGDLDTAEEVDTLTKDARGGNLDGDHCTQLTAPYWVLGHLLINVLGSASPPNSGILLRLLRGFRYPISQTELL